MKVPDRALSVILNTMIDRPRRGPPLRRDAWPQYVWLFFTGYRRDPVGAAMCVALTRLLLPAQLFFSSAAS